MKSQTALKASRIVSLGHYVPSRVVTNHDLEKLMDTTHEWIFQRSGILERRWIGSGDTNSSMALAASQETLKKAGNLSGDDVDAIIYSTLISDYVFPGGGVQLQQGLGCKKFLPALDIRNQCSGFVYALSVADAWIRCGMYKRVLIACSEVHSTSLDITTRGRDIAVLFGDAAACCLMEATDDTSETASQIIDIHIASQGEHADKLCMRDPNPNNHPRVFEDGRINGDQIYPYMDGRFVFKNAVERMTESLAYLLKKNQVTPDQIDFVVAHQANMRINQMVLDQFKIPHHKTHHTIDRYGNTTAATIPITLNEAMERGLVKRGQLVAFIAFGSGFTWGSALLRL